MVREWKDHLREFRPVPPEWVAEGPVLENRFTEEDIDLLRFPVPKWHEEDGGRYIGTVDMVVLRDPETGRINCGTYRMQVHEKASLGIYISEGKDGYLILQKYLQRGEPCPIVAVFGIDPAQQLASGSQLTHVGNTTELDFAGWLKGMPERVIRGSLSGLPIPANAEIAIEGEILPGAERLEGPFGEGTGYSEQRTAPVVAVKALYHRNDPILTGGMPICEPPGKAAPRQDLMNAALIWDQLERAGIREVKGVSCHFGNRLIVVSIRNSYAGHSRQAGLIASQCHRGAYSGNWVLVVDEEIDPSNLGEVMWGLTRADARRAVQLLDYCWGSHMSLLDPSRAFAAGEYPLNLSRATYRSAAIIDACRPVEWDRSWHRIVRPSRALQDRVAQKLSGKLARGDGRSPHAGMRLDISE